MPDARAESEVRLALKQLEGVQPSPTQTFSPDTVESCVAFVQVWTIV